MRPIRADVKVPIPAAQEITETLIRENIVRAAANVFETMLRRPITLTGIVEPAPRPASWQARIAVASRRECHQHTDFPHGIDLKVYK